MRIDKGSLLLIITLSLIILLQSAVTEQEPLIRPFGIICSFFGMFAIAWLTKGGFIRAFSNIVSFIAFYSLIIYVLLFIPSVFNYLYNVLSPHFPSLNVEIAVFEGGGRNFVIYNFFVNYISESIGLRRNCGPFWEPGMFAVYLNLALIFNLFFLKGRQKHNILLIVSLMSTFSAGGYLSLMFILSGYLLLKEKSLADITCIIVLITAIAYFMNAEYVGIKLFSQMDNNEIGDDGSRFGAFFTQFVMIKDHLLLGGASIADYATQTRTLASGVLMPIVNYGIFAGSAIYVCYYMACKNLAKLYSQIRYSGELIFAAILFMSFSQTVLESPVMFTFLFYGLYSRQHATI